MADSLSIVVSNERQFQERLALMIRRTQDPARALRSLVPLVDASTAKNFAAGGRPLWKPSKRALHTGGKTLIKTGLLQRSVETKVTGDTLKVTSSRPYARIHQFGGKIKAHTVRAKRKKFLVFSAGIPAAGGTKIFAKEVRIPEVTMPARPFVKLQKQEKITALRLLLRQIWKR